MFEFSGQTRWPEDATGAWGVRRIAAVTEGPISECTAEIVWQSSTRSMWWGVSLIVSGILGGSLLLAHVPVNLVIAWLIVLAGIVHLILVESIFDFAMFLQLRAIGGSSWVLLGGIVTLILGLMSYMRWPSTAAWAIGVLVSVSLVISGLTRVMFSLAVRKSITPGPGRTEQDDSSAKDYWSLHQ